jgi:plastocyanin
MKRRDFVSTLGLSSAVLMTPAIGGASKPAGAVAAQGKEHGHSAQAPMNGSGANAVINFGQWKSEPPLDRYPNIPPTPPQNSHHLLPSTVQIKAGGSVSFIISGLHQIVVYGPDVAPSDINVTTLVATTGVPPGVPLINDANQRVYRGPDPSLMGTFDRVESVHFPNAGRFLVICGVLPHFVEGMFGYVVVLP